MYYLDMKIKRIFFLMFFFWFKFIFMAAKMAKMDLLVLLSPAQNRMTIVPLKHGNMD